MGQLRTFRRKVLRAQHGAKRLKFVTSTPQKFRMFRKMEALLKRVQESKVAQAFAMPKGDLRAEKKSHGQRGRRGG